MEIDRADGPPDQERDHRHSRCAARQDLARRRALTDHGDDDVVGGYPFCAGDLHGDESREHEHAPRRRPGGDATFWFSTLDDRVRPKRYYFQAGETRTAWKRCTSTTPGARTRASRCPRGDGPRGDARAPSDAAHGAFERAFTWCRGRSADVPAWMRDIALVVTLHGMHYTGFIFNDFAQQLAILKWIAEADPAARCWCFSPRGTAATTGTIPITRARAHGRRSRFPHAHREARALGFKMMPMFGANAANRKQPVLAEDRRRRDPEDRWQRLRPLTGWTGTTTVTRTVGSPT